MTLLRRQKASCRLCPGASLSRRQPHAITGPSSSGAGECVGNFEGRGVGGRACMGDSALCARARMAAALALLQLRQRTTRRPAMRPPAATSLTWSAVRSAVAWAGRPAQPGHQSPTMARWSATACSRRRRSARSLWRSGRRAALRRSTWAWQRGQRWAQRPSFPQSRHARLSVIVACACGACVVPAAGGAAVAVVDPAGAAADAAVGRAAVGAVVDLDVVLARHGYRQRRARVASGTPTAGRPLARTPTTSAPW
jgi:hypothetical protein